MLCLGQQEIQFWYRFNITSCCCEKFSEPLIQKNALLPYWVNKKWNKGGDIHQSSEYKLQSLYDHGREKQVGIYLRNLNSLDKNFSSKCKNRSQCERKHKHIKDTVKSGWIRSVSAGALCYDYSLRSNGKVFTSKYWGSSNILSLTGHSLRASRVNVSSIRLAYAIEVVAQMNFIGL